MILQHSLHLAHVLHLSVVLISVELLKLKQPVFAFDCGGDEPQRAEDVSANRYLDCWELNLTSVLEPCEFRVKTTQRFWPTCNGTSVFSKFVTKSCICEKGMDFFFAVLRPLACAARSTFSPSPISHLLPLPYTFFSSEQSRLRINESTRSSIMFN